MNAQIFIYSLKVEVSGLLQKLFTIMGLAIIPKLLIILLQAQ